MTVIPPRRGGARGRGLAHAHGRGACDANPRSPGPRSAADAGQDRRVARPPSETVDPRARS